MEKNRVVTRLHPLLLLAESSYRRCKRDVAPAADPMSAPAKSIGEVQWSQPATKGDKPAPRSGHTITVRELRSVAPSLAPSNRLRSCSVVGDKAVVFGGCGVTKSNEPCVSNQTYYLHMSADPMKWEEADLMGDVPPPRWRHTATLLPDLVRSAPPSLRRRDAPTQPRSLLHLCSPAGVAHVTGQHHDV
eukprot:scaffold40998_cov63-Phaeocystis_antarctica.AAC.4